MSAVLKRTCGQLTGLLGSGFSQRGAVSASTVARYRDKYSRFRVGVAGHMARLHEIAATAMRLLQVDYEIENDSQVTAHKAIVRYGASVPAFLIGEERMLKIYGGDPEPPPPPEPPRETDLFPSARTQSILSEPRDPTSFYWIDRPGENAGGSLVCEEFRPSRTWSDTFWVLGAEGAVFAGSISLELEATNLPVPIGLNTRVITEERRADWAEVAVLARFPNWMAEILRG